MALMRSRLAPLRLQRQALPWVCGGLIAIVVLVLTTSGNPNLAAMFLGGAAAAFGALALLGAAIRRAARAIPRPRSPLVRTALANLHRPGRSEEHTSELQSLMRISYAV